MRNDGPKLVVLAGPTASGKSHLAVELAQYFGGEIVNADSMQVYRGMDIGTAKPSTQERSGVTHHLMDIVNPDEEFNAALYRSLALPVIREITDKGMQCFLVGGTGLYIRTLLGGLLPSPPLDSQLRENLFSECNQKGPSHLHDRLKRLDSETALRIHPHDRMRIIRALEIILLTGRCLSSLIREHGFRERPFQTLKICLSVNRQDLYERIHHRALHMIGSGLIEETESLLRRGYSPQLRPMKAIGYRHMVKLLRGDCTREGALRELQRDTRHYAKRQLTWFRRDLEVVWRDPADMAGIIELIKRFQGTCSVDSGDGMMA